MEAICLNSDPVVEFFLEMGSDFFLSSSSLLKWKVRSYRLRNRFVFLQDNDPQCSSEMR